MDIDYLKHITEFNNEKLQEGWTKNRIAEALGIGSVGDSTTLTKHLRKAESAGFYVLWPKNIKELNMSKIEKPVLPTRNISIDELWEKRKDEFKRVKDEADAYKNVIIKVHETKPIGLLLFGDPHIDNPGCNVERLLSDVEVAETTEGVYGVNIGDTTDNWVGYLAKFYADHETTEDQSILLMEDLIKRVPWLFQIFGNHNLWREVHSDTLMATMGNVLSADHEIGVELQFDNGKVFTIHARHNYPGNSQWNTVHAITKWAKMRSAYDILIGGHKHTCGYNYVVTRNRLGEYQISHCEQLGSYKQVDDYVNSQGFEDTNISPSVLYILDPNAKDMTGRVQRFPDIDLGVRVLKMMRGE